MGLTKYRRYSASVTRSARWPAMRQQALRRDGFKCVKCGATGRLEVDHIKSVRLSPELAWSLDNLQTLCPQHHTAKTRLECGHPPMKPARAAWIKAVRNLYKP
jgi:5-methylcytosine-specific restriction endonuclease McrA